MLCVRYKFSRHRILTNLVLNYIHISRLHLYQKFQRHDITGLAHLVSATNN
jgi:hypothetical protein